MRQTIIKCDVCEKMIERAVGELSLLSTKGKAYALSCKEICRDCTDKLRAVVIQAINDIKYDRPYRDCDKYSFIKALQTIRDRLEGGGVMINKREIDGILLLISRVIGDK